MEFKAQPRTIRDALTLKRKYVIPRFQREYSWEHDELIELWNDLLDSLSISDNELVASEYFIGSLVLVGDDDDTYNIERQVVDGQQQLMTFTIAFSALCNLLKKNNEERLSDIVHSYIIGEDENGVQYTKVVSETPKPFFQYRIQQKDIDFTQQPNTQEERRILKAYTFFEGRLGEESLLKEIKSRFDGFDVKYDEALKLFRDQVLNCKVIYVTVKSFDDAYTIFEVLNAKGKNLSPADIIKNSLFSILDTTEPIDAAYEKWENIRKKMAEGNVNDIMVFYRHYWLSTYGFVTNRKLVNEFNKKVEKTQEKYGQFLNLLEVAACDYAKIALPNRLQWTQPEDRVVFEALDALNTFGVVQVRSFLLALLDIKRNRLIKHNEYLKTLSYIEYFHFVFNAVCSERPSGLERRYSSFARKLRASTSKEDSANCVHELIGMLCSDLPSYEKFRDGFMKIRYTSATTKEKRLVQYILKKLEQYEAGTDELKPDSFSIEHIMPEASQNNAVGLIGNLLPLGVEINSDLGNSEFDVKVEKYRCSQYRTVAKFVACYGNYPAWNEKTIMLRTDELSKIMYYQDVLPEDV